jgi:hypothetical protein
MVGGWLVQRQSIAKKKKKPDEAVTDWDTQHGGWIACPSFGTKYLCTFSVPWLGPNWHTMGFMNQDIRNHILLR